MCVAPSFAQHRSVEPPRPRPVGEEGASPAASPESAARVGDRDSRQPASEGEKKVKIMNAKTDMLIVRQASSSLETNST